MNPGRAHLTENQWTSLLDGIDRRIVVPVLGKDLLSVPPNDCSEARVVHEIASSLGLRQPTLDCILDGLSTREDCRSDDFYCSLRGVLEHNWPIPKALGQLAAIDKFDIFISLTIDTLVDRALTAAGRPPLSINYGCNDEVIDIPSNYRPVYRMLHGTPDPPVVYRLLGHFGIEGDYALREEEVLRFMHRLQSRDHRPQKLFDVLHDRSLLLLGCSLPGWLARFFLIACKGEGQLARETRASLFADRSSQEDESFARFLERRGALIIPGGDASSFVANLADRWRRRTSAGAAHLSNAPSEGDIFLSYSREDLPLVARLAEQLRAQKLPVWMDQSHILPGDNWAQRLQQGIEECSVFLPVLSIYTLKTGYFENEWRMALSIREQSGDTRPLILPMALDPITPDMKGLPPEFAGIQWARLRPDGRAEGAELAHILSAYRRFQLQRQGAI